MSKARFSTQVPTLVAARVRAVVRGMQHLYGPDYTLSQFTTDALTEHAARLEQDHHRGEPFPAGPQREAPLRSGRRIAAGPSNSVRDTP